MRNNLIEKNMRFLKLFTIIFFKKKLIAFVLK